MSDAGSERLEDELLVEAVEADSEAEAHAQASQQQQQADHTPDDDDALGSDPGEHEHEAVAVAAPPARRPKSPGLIADLAAAEAAAAATDTPLQPHADDSDEDAELLEEGEEGEDEEGSAAGDGTKPKKKKKGPQLDAQALQLPHLPSPFDADYPQSRGGDRWKSLTPDSHCMLCQLEPGEGPTVPVLNRVYVHVVGKLQSGTLFFDFDEEELDFTLGQAQVPKGLEMAVCHMRAGEYSLVRCCADYGFSATRRPKGFPADAPLFFAVRVLRWEKEKNLHQMTWDDKMEYVERRRQVGRDLFAKGAARSAAKQYEKALTVLESVKEHEVAPECAEKRRQLLTLFLVNQAQCSMKIKDYSKVLELTGKVAHTDIQVQSSDSE